MSKITTLLFDLGGVIITLDEQQAIRRFSEIGLQEAIASLDPYTQTGIFGKLEAGIIDDDQFRREASLLAKKDVSWQECLYAWTGYCGGVPQRNLDKLKELRDRGLRLVLVSNTNPFMMHWAMSSEFDGKGNPLQSYFDKIYMSYKIKAMKPDKAFFEAVIEGENLNPGECLFIDDGQRNIDAARLLGFNTFKAENGADWTNIIDSLI